MMSGHKHATITISQDEYRRLHELDMEQRFNKKRKSDKDAESRYTALWNAYREIEERQKEYEAVITSLNQEMAYIEADQTNEILSYQAEYYQSLVDQLQDAQVENTGLQNALEETTRYFAQVIQNEQTKVNERFNVLLQQVDSMAHDQSTKEEQAREWINSCTQLSGFIRDKYNHEKFFPKEHNRILDRLNLAVQNLNQGYFDSALQFAQEAILQLSELRSSLEEKTSEWQAKYQVLREEAQHLFEEVSNTPVIPAIGIEGEELHIDIDLDYWSNGIYNLLQKRLNTLVSMLDQYRDEIGFEDFETLSSQTIPQFRTLFSEIVYKARQNSINSQVKINIAYLAMKALEKHGFSLNQAQYKDGDMRDSFSAELSDEDGSNILLQITPNKVSYSNNLTIDTIDDTIHTEDEFMRRWEEINNSLEEAGVQVGQVQVAPLDESLISRLSPIENGMKTSVNLTRNYYYVQTNRASTPTS